MGLDLWFHDDVLRILSAVVAGAGQALAANEAADAEYAAAYRQGFEDAVRAIATGFGVADRRNGRLEGWKADRPADW